MKKLKFIHWHENLSLIKVLKKDSFLRYAGIEKETYHGKMEKDGNVNCYLLSKE